VLGRVGSQPWIPATIPGPAKLCVSASGVHPYLFWWQLMYTFLVIGVLALAVLISAGWAISLRRRFRQQTEIIRRQVEKESAMVEAYRELLVTAGDIVYTQSLNGTFTSINRAVESITGFSGEELIGASFERMAVPEHRDRPVHTIERMLRGELTRSTFELDILTKSGRRKPLEVSAQLLYQDGRPSGIQGIARDITEYRRTARELERAKEVVELVSRAKSQFLANISHEIRVPLNGIIGMTDQVLNTPLSQEQQENLKNVKESALALLEIIGDILDFSRIEAGGLDLAPIEFNLRDSIDDTLRNLVSRARRKGLELDCHIPAGIPEVLVGDPGRLRQILVNLVGNAIQFTESGMVEVVVGVESESEDSICVHFSVSDTGMGIPPEKQRMMFEPLTQADDSTSRDQGGAGLGLTIAAQLIELMGGRIWVESETGKGSTFHFTAVFKLAKDPLKRTSRAAPLELLGVPAIVVDANEAERRLLGEILLNWGVDAILLEKGEEALRRMERAARIGEPFRLIILDADLPAMDGFAVAEQIRRKGLAGTAILMLTSVGMRGDAGRCRELGIAGYLPKPVEQDELIEAICSIYGAGGEDRTGDQLVTRHTIRESRGAGSISPQGAGSRRGTEAINRLAALAHVEGDVGLLRELTDMFMEDYPASLSAIRAAIASGNGNTLQQAAHKLKGMLASLFAQPALQASLQLEELGRAGDIAGAETAYADLETEIERLKTELTAFVALEQD
jgi:PAS domain S-box-containing protein